MQRLLKLCIALTLISAGLQVGPAAASDDLSIREFTVDNDALCEVRDQWIADVLRENPQGTWAEMKLELNNEQLAKLGLPSKEVLTSLDTSQPKLVTQDGQAFDVPVSELESAMAPSIEEPTLATFAGTGCLGIRPGAFYLIESGNSISLCSLAHLYGGAISTAGHCGRTGDTATVIAATGNRADVTGVVLLDFGTFGTSHDNGLGDDYALINIDPAYSALVTPTMCFWGGPRGVYQAEGATVGFEWGGQGPSVSVDPNPFLAQTIVHYGHGLGIGAGGTPRVAAAIAWTADHFMFTGAITPGDSGSGANTLLGDAVGANMQAAGIITHIWVDALMRDGIGIMGGTRASKVGTATNGQIVPYPIPISGLP